VRWRCGPIRKYRPALDKAQRDKQEEESYKENESSHFTLRYSGAAEPALAREYCTRWKRIFQRLNPS